MVPPVDTPVGKLGLSICYDLRFLELSIWNRKSGAQILSFPSAFTLNTGLAHWEVFLRDLVFEIISFSFKYASKKFINASIVV